MAKTPSHTFSESEQKIKDLQDRIRYLDTLLENLQTKYRLLEIENANLREMIPNHLWDDGR